MNEKELRRLINEVTAEIIAESQINSGDKWYSGEHETLGDRKFADRQANAGSDADNDGTSDADELRAIADMMDAEKAGASAQYDHLSTGYEDDRLDQDEAELEDYPQATHFSDDPGNAEFEEWSRAVVTAMDNEMIAHPKDIPWLEDIEGNAELALIDEWKAGTSPEEYASLFDQYNAGGLESDDDDERRWNMSESKGFTFDKFMKDINGREDKIAQHKKELTENDGDSYARTKQRLYQEDWRNSVKFKGDK